MLLPVSNLATIDVIDMEFGKCVIKGCPNKAVNRFRTCGPCDAKVEAFLSGDFTGHDKR